MTKTFYYSAEDLKDYMERFFRRYQLPEDDAGTMAKVILEADLRGVDSHGISKLYAYYGNRLAAGCVDVTTPTSVVRETATTVLFDGGNGLGPVNGCRAMQACIAKAEENGMGAASVRNSNHYGIAGYYALMALTHDFIGISLTNSEPLIAPTFGRTRQVGTNPIAVAIPAGEHRPFVLDMATSIKALGRVLIREAEGEAIPLGWGIDSRGELTSDPAEVHRGGALLPLGGTEEMSGYKGYGLALMVEILSGVLAGAAFGGEVGSPLSTSGPPADVGHFFMALNVQSFRPLNEFKRDMDALLEQLVRSPRAVGKDRIYIHGEKEFEHIEECRRNGVPVIEPVVEELTAKGKETGVEFDLQPLRIC